MFNDTLSDYRVYSTNHYGSPIRCTMQVRPEHPAGECEMDFETLLRRYEALLAENKALKEENLALKARLGLGESVSDALPSPEQIQPGFSRLQSPAHVDAKPIRPKRFASLHHCSRGGWTCMPGGGKARTGPRPDICPSFKMKESLVFAENLRSSAPHATIGPMHPWMKMPSMPI